MLRHRDVWKGIDRLAKDHGYSPSGLARAAGLDPTSFNKSKRTGPKGRDRWPSTESLAKIFRVTGVTMADFVKLVGKSAGTVGSRKYAAITLAQAAKPGAFGADGLPDGKGWTAIDAPEFGDDDAFAIKIGNDALSPVYARGTLLMVSPAADIKRGDRVVLCTLKGDLVIGEATRRNKKETAVKPFAGRRKEVAAAADDILFAYRIIWASQ